MSAKTGAFNLNAGPHLPSGTPHSEQATADPAKGERVPRCWTCGLPELADNRLLPFGLTLRGKRAGRWQLCERCYWRRNPPPTAVDPLEVAQPA